MANAAINHRIVIEPATIRGDRGQYHRVYFQDGVLIEDTWNPEFEACRALVARGVTGRLEVWRAGAAYPGSPTSKSAPGGRSSRMTRRGPSSSGGCRIPTISIRMPFPPVRRCRQRPDIVLG